MIKGYADQASIYPGQVVTLHVSTDAPAFRVEFYRQGEKLDLQMTSDWRAGSNVPPHPSDADWGLDWTSGGQVIPGWPAYDFAIPPDQAPGVLIAMFVEGDGQGNERGNTPPLDRTSADARSAKALFVVKNPAPGTCAPILYQLPLLTYQAYNAEGGWSLYQRPPVPVVTLRRPGGGTGGTPAFGPYPDGPPYLSDLNDPTSPAAASFAHWDGKFIAWLEAHGYPVDYCTDLDIDADNSRSMLGAYRLLLSVGHDEYWTTGMRDNVEAFVNSGGNVAFFSGNTCWWQITFDDPNTIRRTFYWSDPAGPNRPENSLTGVSYRNAGGYWSISHKRKSIGYTIQHSGHWVFNGTGRADGDTFGVDEQLIGYECDGANFDRTQGPPYTPRGDDGTPPDFTILGVGDVTDFGTDPDPDGSVPGEALGNRAATMGIRSGAGTVFTGATVDWPRVVADNAEPTTVAITANVLRGLSGSGAVDVALAAAGRTSPPDTSSLFAFAKTTPQTPCARGEIWFNQKAEAPDQDWVGWLGLPGPKTTDPPMTTDAPVAAAMQDGTLFVFAKKPGTSGEVMYTQAAPGAAFSDWQSLGIP